MRFPSIVELLVTAEDAGFLQDCGIVWPELTEYLRHLIIEDQVRDLKFQADLYRVTAPMMVKPGELYPTVVLASNPGNEDGWHKRAWMQAQAWEEREPGIRFARNPCPETWGPPTWDGIPGVDGIP